MRASITRDAPITPHEITSAGPSAEQQPDGPRRITPTLADAILSEVEDDVAQDGWLWVDGLIVIIEGNDDADLRARLLADVERWRGRRPDVLEPQQ
jgi:hypothetical protein